MIRKPKADATTAFFCQFICRFHTTSVGKATSAISISMSNVATTFQKMVYNLISIPRSTIRLGILAVSEHSLSKEAHGCGSLHWNANARVAAIAHSSVVAPKNRTALRCGLRIANRAIKIRLEAFAKARVTI